jgi:hypothetical protein
MLTLRALAERAGVSISIVQELESGEPASLETYARVTTALGLRPELLALDPRQQRRAGAGGEGGQDVVHAAMGELEAGRLRGLGFGVGMDEPYQHYQFAGRADVVAWDLDRRALLHIENRTAFPNVQDALGSYAAKRSYLAGVLADRFEIRRGWLTVSHCIAALWSAEVMHQLRIRAESFRSACPDPPVDFAAWWAGRQAGSAVSSAFVLLDPALYVAEERRFGSLDDALRVRPRYRDYANAAERLKR